MNRKQTLRQLQRNDKMDKGAGGPFIFDDIVFTIIPSDDLDAVDIARLQRAIEAQGGQHIPLEGDDQHIADIENLNCIISTHIDFPQYHSALQHGLHVVKPSWVTHSLQKGKQAPQRQYSPDPSQFFQDVIFTCADLPAGDVRAITAGVMVLGGQFSAPLTKLVTHIVATSMDNERCVIAQERGLNCKIVLPHWIDACLKLGKKISEKPYLLPNPEVLRADNGSSIRSNPALHLAGAIVATPTSLPPSSQPPSPSKSRKTLNAFISKKIFLATDLDVSGHILKTIEELIDLSGGAIVQDVDAADIYIGQFREGEDYAAASRAGKEVANLSWLYHVVNQNKYTNPLSKLLHYPVPPNGIPGFENMKISISNYSGDARTYVENLVRYCGAEFTKTMKQDNTHLITAHMQSEKCEAAQEWNINIVNHLWLEESYAKCAVQTLSNPRYSTFPARTNLGEVAGQTMLDMKSVERAFFPRPRSPQKPRTPSKPSKATATATTPTRPPVPTIPEPDAMTADIDAEAAPEPSAAKKSRGRPRKSLGTPRASEDKENESPVITSVGRASKAKALSNLHEQANDIALFQKEMKRKGGVLHGGRRSEDADRVESPAAARTSRKRTSDEYEASALDGDLSDGETQEPAGKQTKKVRTVQALPPIHTRMMVTGYDRWKDDEHTESADRDTLRALGIALTTDPRNVDMLVAPRLARTRKFVSALAAAPLVVDTGYLDAALSNSKLPAEKPRLEDREGEARLGFRLADSLKRAKANQGKLLEGWSIFITKDVSGGFETYKEIVEVNGGDAYLYGGLTGIVLPKRRRPTDNDSMSLPENADEEYDHVYLVSGESKTDQKLRKTFRDVARKQELESRTVSTEWLLNAAMSQRIEFNEKWLL